MQDAKLRPRPGAIVIACIAALLALPTSGAAQVEPSPIAAREPVAAPSTAPRPGSASEPSCVVWPTEADKGIVYVLPIHKGVAIALDTELSGRVDRVITLRGESAALPATRDSLGSVIYKPGGLAVLLPKLAQAFYFTLGNPTDAAWIRAHAPAHHTLTIVAESLEVARYVGDFGPFTEHRLPSIFNQDPGDDAPPPSPGCASQCTISCRDGSSCSCSAGASGCCSCTCSAVGGATCSHSP